MHSNLLHYTQSGQGVPLVLLHGWGFDHRIWHSILPDLTNHFTIYTVDLPGFGNSLPMDWEDFKTQMLAILPTTFGLVGWSLGGLYATRLALEVPHRVSSLLNIASSPRFIQDATWPGVPQVVFDKFYHHLSVDINTTLHDFVSLQLGKNSCIQLGNHNPSENGLKAGLEVLANWDLRHALHGFEVPTSYIFGRLDPITPVKTMHTMQTIYPHCNYVLFNQSAHMPFLSQKKEFIEHVRGFIL